MRGELRDPIQDQAGAAADLEFPLALGVPFNVLDLEIVEHPVVGQVALALVPAREVIVVGTVIEPGHRALTIPAGPRRVRMGMRRKTPSSRRCRIRRIKEESCAGEW